MDGMVDHGMGATCLQPTAKTKRMRTSFKHAQLKAMKEHFQTNQNPDSKELKHLAQKTGLPKRVLQVTILLPELTTVQRHVLTL